MGVGLRRFLRRLRRGAWYVLAIGLVLMALGAGITSQLLPLAERHPDRIAEWLGQRAGRPVSFDRLETAWTRRGPLLRLDGLRIGEGEHAIPVGEAEVLVAQYAGLLPGRSFTELRLRGLELRLERDDDGRWQVRGLPGQAQSDGDPFAALEGLGELQVAGGVLEVVAPGLGVQARLDDVSVRVRVDGNRVRAAARASMHGGESPLDIVARLDRDSGAGEAWIALRRADLSAWSGLRAGHVLPVAGTGRLQAWATLDDYRAAAVTVRGELEGLRLRGEAAGREVEVGALDLDARWTTVAGGWRLDAPRLRLGAGDGSQVLDGLLLAGGRQRALLVERVDLGALLVLAPLAPGLGGEQLGWLREARPGAVLSGVEVAGEAGGALRAWARVDALGFAPRGSAPGVAGLAGELAGDADGLVFALDPESPVSVDWPDGFGPPPHRLRLAGDIVAWREGAGWQLRSPALRIDGEGYGADLRGGLLFQGDGTRPAIDLVAELDEARVPVAKRFWIRRLMPEAAVEWLDRALVDGRVAEGRALVSGDLDHWPFRPEAGAAGRGLFHASARIEDGVVAFDPGWPAAEALSGRVDFIGSGFRLDGSGRLGGVEVSRLGAGIEDFDRARLEVEAELAGDASAMLAVLRDSPLRQQREEALDGLSAAGPARGTFAMALRLHGRAGGPRLRVSGGVALDGVRLEEKRWDLVLDEVRGSVRYDEAGFSAEGLRVLREGQPGRLALRAGPSHVEERGAALEGRLELPLDSTELAGRAPELAWLAERMQGRSAWALALSLPEGGGDGRLRLSSNLAGTRLALPAPLGKAAAEALPARIDLKLPLGAEDIDVVLGERVALRARSRGGRTGVLAVLGAGRVDAAPPDSGIRVTGRAPALDALEWAGLVAGDAGGGASGDALPLRGLDLQVGQLQLLGSVFPDTRVIAAQERGTTRVQFEGAALAGRVEIPRGEGAALSAQLQRLHWRGAAARDGGEAGTESVVADSVAQEPDAGPAVDEGIDPASIPPLAIVVEDLRLGDAAMGRMELQAQPVAGGMRMESMRLRAPGQDIDIDGTWTGSGAGARTRLRVSVESGDFGTLLAAFGVPGRIDGGSGSARFEGSWPGTPAGFSLGKLEGSLALAVKDGRLLEVEPGAGRVLGLLSVAELPRRLTLDFSDFFSRGFVFNRVDGTLRFSDGLARSEKLVIDGAAAEIHIRGSADLRAQTYDQEIEVHPRTGGLLTAVGALTAGPVGAAVGAVANAMFEKPLGRMGARVYRVTGPWKDPRVVVEGRELPPASPSPPPDGGGGAEAASMP